MSTTWSISSVIFAFSASPDVHVGTNIVGLVDPAEGGHLAVHFERHAVHHEETNVALVRAARNS